MDHFINSPGAHAVALFFAFVAFVVSLHLLYRHMQHYNRPILQRQIVRIVLIVPVYAVCSALALSFEPYAVYINTVRDCYEAYCIHCFLVLMLDFPGGEAAVVEGIKHKDLMKHPVPFCYCPKIALGTEFIMNMKRTTLQFVVIKPVMALLAIIARLGNFWDSDGLQIFLLIVYNVSYTTALYGLFLFYLGTKHLLKGFSPVGKFSAVKVIVFATYYQSLLVVMVPGMDDLGGSEKWNDWFICFEMALFAVMHEFCFSYKEFLPGGVGVKDLKAQGFDEPINIREDTSWAAVQSRLGDVFSLQDTVDDLKRLFRGSETSEHVQLGVEGGIVAEGTAQRVVDQMADAAKSGVAKLAKLSRVRVVEEGDLNTDKESLFASAPGGVVLVKQIREGVEKLSRMGRARGDSAANAEGAAGAGGDDMYSFIVPVGGTADAVKIHVNTAEELQAAAKREQGVRAPPPPPSPPPARPRTLRTT